MHRACETVRQVLAQQPGGGQAWHPIPAVTRYAYESFWIAWAVTKVCLCARRSDIHLHEGIDVVGGVTEELLEASLTAGGGCVSAELCVEAGGQAG